MRLRPSVYFGLALCYAGAALAQQNGFYTTHDNPPGQQTLPWKKTETAPAPSPGYVPSVPDPNALPFQRGNSMPSTYQPVIQGGPAQQAVPIESFDAIEVTEPAAPTDNSTIANPVDDDPAEPTELTSPLFSAEVDTKTPRTVELRVLNKVTARAETLVLKPGEEVEFGKLRILAQNCYRSVPESQPDAVALLDIKEHIHDQEALKELFHGWMYASSPSITALEHPIYDVTMVACRMQEAKPADALKDEAKKGKKASEKKKK